MTELYSFSDLFNKPVSVIPGVESTISQIVIPKIQRPYAQGRTDGQSTYVRSIFLKNIFAHLSTGAEMEMNFIYGIVRKMNERYIFELLDGQQRITTLFLLHWYIVNAECTDGDDNDKAIRDSLRRFIYETRATSSVFCNKLAGFRADLSDTTPREAIRKAKWYFKAFDRDSTVTAMLTMLDDIHRHYVDSGRDNLLEGLGLLRFYVKSLGHFNLSEELYIKMNARGLQLSPFENFKADISNFISSADFDRFKELVPVFSRGNSTEVPFMFNFSVKLDAKWIDIFWRQGSETFDKAYMNFFIRFFAVKYILQSDKTEKELRDDKILKSLYKEDGQSDTEYLGFDIFRTILDPHPEYIIHLDTVLDTIFTHRDFIASLMVAEWDKTDRNNADYIFCGPESRTPLAKLAVIGAVFEYIAANEEAGIRFDKEDFRRWMRVVWNIVENTNIDSISPVGSLVRKFSRLAGFVTKRMYENDDFYKSLAGWADEQNANELRAVKEEVEKASRIAEDSRWEEIFTKAEHHPFFKGMVLFYYTSGITPEEFERRTTLAGSMFDAGGITPQFRHNHLLIRAIMSCYTSYTGNPYERLWQKYITENAESDKYLKNTLANNDNVRSMFGNILGQADAGSVMELLEARIESAGYPDNDGDENGVAYHMTLRRLRHDTKLYDLLAHQEAIYRKTFRLYDFEGQYAVAIPNKRVARVTIESDRAVIAQRLIKDFDLSYYDPKQEEMAAQYGEVVGTDLWLYRTFNDNTTLYIGFMTKREFVFQINCPDEETASMLIGHIDGLVTDDDNKLKLLLTGGRYVTSDYSLPEITGRLDTVIKAINECLSTE